MEGGIIPTVPLPQFEKDPSELLFAYSLYGVLFHIRSKMATDLLENFMYF